MAWKKYKVAISRGLKMDLEESATVADRRYT